MVFIDIWTLLTWLIYRKYYTTLKKWRNKKDLYNWYRITAQPLYHHLPSFIIIIRPVSSFIISYFSRSHFSIMFHVKQFWYLCTFSSVLSLVFCTTSASSTQSSNLHFPFPFPLTLNPHTFPILQSIPLAIISLTISRHNSYHYITYPYHLT